MLSIRIRRRLSAYTLSVSVECRDPVTAVFGPSGSGKTTLLNLVAGLMRPDEGEVRINNEILFSSDEGVDVAPERRRLGYVFQEDLLFPHLDVRRNLRFGYDLLAAGRRRFHPDPVVDLLSLGPLLHRMPAQLSGGERQRVALGRAILASPRMLLMDEPLASMDQGLKDRIIPYLRHIRSDLKIPILYVSHSVAEILELTGHVIVLREGKVLAHGNFFDIAHKPEVLPLVKAHGFENGLEVEVAGTDIREGVSRVRYNDQTLTVPECGRLPGRRIFIGIRAGDVILARSRPEGLSARNALPGRIVELTGAGGRRLVYVDVGNLLAVEVTAEAVRELGLKTGEPVVCLVKTHSIRIGPDVE